MYTRIPPGSVPHADPYPFVDGQGQGSSSSSSSSEGLVEVETATRRRPLVLVHHCPAHEVAAVQASAARDQPQPGSPGVRLRRQDSRR